jgi:hypothetical protein
MSSIAEPVRHIFKYLAAVATIPGCPMDKHPLHQLLHKHIGIDSFALDGDDTRISEGWDEKPRRLRHD